MDLLYSVVLYKTRVSVIDYSGNRLELLMVNIPEIYCSLSFARLDAIMDYFSAEALILYTGKIFRSFQSGICLVSIFTLFLSVGLDYFRLL